MAGTVVQTRTTNSGKEKFERHVTLTMVSDAAAGTVPDTTLGGLAAYELREVVTTPGAAPPTTAYRVRVTSVGSGEIFLGDARSAAGAAETQGGHETLGFYPPVHDTLTLRIAGTANTDAGSMGNSKNLTVKLIFGLRG